MSKRVLLSSLIGALALGGVAAGGLALAATPTDPTLENGSARYAAPSGSRAGWLTYTVDVSDDSGVSGLKVIAWPASSRLDPTEKELLGAESATCRSTAGGIARCTYTLKVTQRDAAEPAKDTWYVTALATAEDGGTAFVPRAASFELTP
ncbi:DUF5707 domain-containing protein [Streptomyces anulatus]